MLLLFQDEPEYAKVKNYIESYNASQNMKAWWKLFGTFYTGGDALPEFTCKARLPNDIAIVDIFFSNQFATTLSRDVTATFTFKIANIGFC